MNKVGRLKTSIKIGSISGIPIKLHITLLFVVGFIAWSVGSNVFQIADLLGIDNIIVSNGYKSYLIGLIIAVGLFLSVFVHEMAHSLTARNFGVNIEEITLWIFGGVSNMDEIPHEPSLEIKISVIGPLMSLILGGLFYAVGLFSPFSSLVFIFKYLGIINVFLAGFNLLPAFPMDGGRILRALLSRNRTYVSATKKSAEIGKGFAIFLAILGIFARNPFFIIIALFVFIGASQEAKTVVVREVLQKVKIEEIMSEDVKVVDPNMDLNEFLDYVFDVQHTGFPVIKNSEIKGVMTLEDAKKVDQHRIHEFKVRDVMEKDVVYFSPNDNVSDLWQDMMEKDIGRFPIVSDSELVGIVTRSDVMHSFKILKEVESYRGGEI